MSFPKLMSPVFAAPTRRIVTLPDAHFFIRSIPLVNGEGDEGPAAQIELAIESLSPFPVAQLYHGYYTRPGSGRALVFAAYRKRFPADETATWSTADLVVPAFALLLGAPAPAGATTWLIAGADSLTALHFDDDSGVPSAVAVQALPSEAGEADLAAARERLLRGFSGSRAVVDLHLPVLDDDATGEKEMVFRVGDIKATIGTDLADALDVRDKAELASRRAARVRDQWLWRSLLGAAAIIALCAFGEVLMVGLRMMQDSRVTQVSVQTPLVMEITTKRNLATRIEELASKRLLPLEMISIVYSVRPPNIQLMASSATSLYTVQFEAQTPTSSQAEIDAFQVALRNLPSCQDVVIRGPETRAGMAVFTILVTFKPDAVKPAET